MRRTDQDVSRRILAILFFLYSFLHLIAAGFLWLVIIALVKEGYRDSLRDLRTLIFLGITLATVVMPLLSGYALLRAGTWARAAVCLTCAAILIANLIVLRQISVPALSVTRLIFGILYGGVSLALCAYGFWFVGRSKSWLAAT